MRKNVPTQFSDRFRQISARARLANERPKFAEFPMSETPYAFTQFCQYIADGVAYQYGLRSGNATIYTALAGLNDNSSSVTRTFTALTLAFPAGAPITENHRALTVAPGGELYAALNGKIYRRVLWEEKDWIWQQIADLIDPVSLVVPQITLAAINATQMVAAAVYASTEVQDVCKISILNNAGGIDTWEGYLPKHANRPNMAAYIETDGVIHIYVDDWSGKKPVYLRRFAAGIWSATKKILPMDALDDDSSFSVGYVSKLANGRVFLTGVVKRKYGSPYSIYMLGPDKFTYGRDLIIKANYDKPLMIGEGDGYIWGVGKDDLFRASAGPGIFSTASPTTEADLFRATMEFQANAADRLSMELPVKERMESYYDLTPGAMVDLDVTVNGASYTVGRYAIDRFREVTRQDGQTFQVDCSSYAMKKLLDWQSDTYFDYMGQGESHGDPGDLTKLVRFSGGKYTSPTGGGLQLESLNDDGMLYATVPASHGGFIRCKFDNLQTADVMVGVGLNYGEETLAEAAARLGKKVEEVKAGERGRWAIIAVYIPDSLYNAPAGQGCISLYDYNTLRVGMVESSTVPTPYRWIGSIAITRPASSITLAMQYQDGYARVYYATQGSNAFNFALSKETRLQWDRHPTEHENYGRGLVFMRNNAGFHMSYPIMSDSDVIPLYDYVAGMEKYGWPIEDMRYDKFPAASGSVRIDSERITYTGIAGWSDNRRALEDLDWLPGKILCQAGDGVTTPAGTPTTFASSRGSGSPHVHGNNYFLQALPASTRGNYVTALRIWLKKVNYPEDGVTVSINQGNVSNSANSVALVNNVKASGSMAPGSSLKTEGGWVTYFFDNFFMEADKEYWIMIRRNKNANHPSSTAYFQFMKMNDNTLPNAGVYVFCEEDDQAVGQSGDAAFVLYGRVEEPNKEACIIAKYKTNVGLPTGDPTQSYFNGCAVVITNGSGKNNCYRIVRSFRWTSGANDLYLFYVDRDPGRIFDLDTKLRAVPAMYGLSRAQGGTTASAHGDKSMVHKHRDQFAKAVNFEFYSAEEDLMVAEVAESIARKAGVIEVDKCNRHPGNLGGTNMNFYIPALSKNFIAVFDVPTLATLNDYVNLSFYDSANRERIRVNCNYSAGPGGVNRGYLSVLTYSETNVATTYLSLPYDENFRGEIRMSLYDGHASVWCGGRILGAANLGSGMIAWSKVRATSTAGIAPNVKVMVPQAGTRVDNFVMDMGKTGAQLLSSLVGEARIYYRDDGTGKLKIYTDRETVPSAYTRAMSVSNETTDIGLATRVLLEGGEVVEVSNIGNLDQHGNLFKTFNFSAINNLDDAKYFADMVLEDMSLNRERVEIDGYAHPVFEPTDILDLQLTADTARYLVVDGLTHTLSVDENEAGYDMRVSGRYKGVVHQAGGGGGPSPA